MQLRDHECVRWPRHRGPVGDGLIPPARPFIFRYMNINGADMQASAQEAAELMRVLGNEKRLMILCLLVEGERSVGQLVDQLGARQAAVSQQLGRMRHEGLVRSRRDGQTIFYSLGSDAARRVVELLYAIYCTPVSESPDREGMA